MRAASYGLLRATSGNMDKYDGYVYVHRLFPKLLVYYRLNNVFFTCFM